MNMASLPSSLSRTIAVLFVACVVLAVAAPAPVLGQADDASIDDLFITAATAFKAGRYKEAVAALETIAEVNPAPLILFNIGRCYEELEEFDKAETAFVRALQSELPDAQRQETRDRLKTLREIKEKAALEALEEENRKSHKGHLGPGDPELGSPDYRLPSILLALHAGVSMPQVFSEMEGTASFGLEVGFVMPFDVGPFVRPLELSFGLAFTKPTGEGSGFDAGLGQEGSGFDWSLEQRTLNVDLGAAWRFAPLTNLLSIYVQAGPRLYLIESVLDASEGGVGFGVQRETTAEAGFFVAGGLDLKLGPGSIFGALEVGGRGVDESLAGSTNTGALAIDLGYRVHF